MNKTKNLNERKYSGKKCKSIELKLVEVESIKKNNDHNYFQN